MEYTNELVEAIIRTVREQDARLACGLCWADQVPTRIGAAWLHRGDFSCSAGRIWTKFEEEAAGCRCEPDVAISTVMRCPIHGSRTGG